jgi:lysophospholipase L1-like esterase
MGQLDALILKLNGDLASIAQPPTATAGQVWTADGAGSAAFADAGASDIAVADFATGVIDTDLSAASTSDDTIPSAKAVKTRLTPIEQIVNRFEGINVLVTGDSFVEANARTTKNWHSYLDDWLGLGTVYNDGASGSGLIKTTGIDYRIPTWTATYGTDIDMILIFGNMNDGTSDTTGAWNWIYGTDDAHKDDYATAVTTDNMADSLWYALRYLCETLITDYPLLPIGYIISPPRSQTATKSGDARSGYDTSCYGRTSWFEEWTDVIKEVCGHYSIPVLDLYHESGLRPWNATCNLNFFSCALSPSGDGIHPNASGHEILARKIYEFVMQYMDMTTQTITPGDTTIADTFDRTDSTSSLGSTDTGNAAWTANNGTWGINTNTAYVSAGSGANIATINPGVADCSIEEDHKFGGNEGGLIFRYADAQNYIMATIDGTNLYLKKRVANSLTTVSTYALPTSNNVIRKIKITGSGSSVIVSVDDTARISETIAELTANTKHGLYTYTSSTCNNRHDNFAFLV